MRKGRCRTLVAALAALAVAAGGSSLVARPGSASEPEPAPLPAGPPLPEVDASRPLTVVVRGWLWDPASRVDPPGLVYFPDELNRALAGRLGVGTALVQYRWSRLPKYLPSATRALTAYARALSDKAAAQGRCVNFIGHSAGAVIVYAAATQGVRMGYMGTLGLPTAGSMKPASVTQWTNFYTVDRKDLAGVLWGSGMAADRNVNTGAPHKELWSSSAVIAGSADGIAAAWNGCRP